ncbi:probable LRR receptor-like serine/threonine-protein kinase At1g56130 [Cornus florida]|uniref:probable LRR receptor-like serine/threonine-protein kinase At1g56130 n=1 Tax=Cornus florida TaxID=4283 RepID=UPI0028A2C409|nr:probable LRR receptor-like serine/threonine-protein kinase At1g56130 [Cornus florida]
MELQLSLALPTQNPMKDVYYVKKKRSVYEAFGSHDNASDKVLLPLLLWNGQPNEEEEDDDPNGPNKRVTTVVNSDNSIKGEENQVVGWPPIKSWRKKLLSDHDHQVGRIMINNNRTAERGRGGSNSMYVKVKMEGVAIGRKVDLRLYHSYGTLTNTLITMFARYQKSDKDGVRYTLTYQDKDGDWLLAGDVPWQTFIESVQRMEILRSVMGILSFSFFVISIFEIVAAQPATAPDEVAALNKMIADWNLSTKLNFTIDPCTKNATWAAENANPQIMCDYCTANTCHVTHLKIYALDISGLIPTELFVLKELRDLNLGQNVLSGPIPAEIGQLSNMQYLSLGINNLTGRVPPELGNLTKLLSLSFGSNNLNGPLPTELGKLTLLQQLYIDSSGVSGPIPLELANLKSLEIMWAFDNRFTGKLPEFFGTLTALKDLRIHGTMLQGPIPNSYGALTKLADLRIGDLSEEDSSLNFLENLTSLSTLSLRNSRVAGQLPEKLGTFSNLQSLDLSFNKLTGQIPNSFQDFASLQYLYLGSNNLSGELPPNIVTQKLVALDVSFNSISGNLPQHSAKAGLSVNVVGTSINADSLLDGKTSGMLHCLLDNNKCSNKVPATSFSIKCGGTEQVSASGIRFDDDSETLGAASFYASSDNQWAVSNTGIFISNPNGPRYITNTDSQITETLESELYKTARISPSSLRYYGLGLKNGKYSIDLHFAEIQMEDTRSWKGLGRRLFDVYIQGEKVLQDFNIQEEAGGSKRALVKTFEANVTNTIMDIHFFWAGRGSCCIPFQSTYGPLVSAIHVSQVSDGLGSSNRDKKRIGRFVGIAVGCAAGVMILSSVFYLWWTKYSQGHTRVETDSPKKG